MAAAEVATTEVPEAAPSVMPPSEVGNAFARQYYTILQQNPALVYRFYRDESQFGRVECGSGGIMGSISTMEAIDEKIQSYGSLRAEIKFVDAQESYNGGVFVLVSGSMIDADDSRRRFIQTFFLAPQDKGFYVLNDMLRYVDDEMHLGEQKDRLIAPTSAWQEYPIAQENNISEHSNGEVYNPCENGDVSVEEELHQEEEKVPEPEPEPEPVPVPEIVDVAPKESQKGVASNAKVEELPRKSYASIVMKDAPAAVISSNPPKSVPTVFISAAVPPSSDAELVGDGNMKEPEEDGHSIYVRNLPENVTFALVEETFQQFGPIKSGGIQIRHTYIKGGLYYGFVEFETAAAVENAIKASPIMIDGYEVRVEEKRSNSRGSSAGYHHGRYPPGRGGSGFRGGRGRGSYGGGKGHGRGESNKNDFGGKGSGGGRGGDGEEYSRTDQPGSESGRANRGGARGRGSSRAQRVPAQA